MESELERHVRFFLHHLRMLPNEYQSVDSNRMTLVRRSGIHPPAPPRS